MADLLQTVNLRTTTPAGWTLAGFSAPRSDGVNPYRVVQRATQLQFSTAAPRYARLQLQLFSPTQDITATVKLDGQDLGTFHFPAGKFISFYPGGLVGAGAHTLSLEQQCAAACEIHQYHAEVQLYSVEVAQQPVGYHAWRWSLNAPGTALGATGLFPVRYDGATFYRSLAGPQPATITLPKGVRPTNLHYITQADHGSYKLHWFADGQSLTVRNDLPGEWSPAGQNANQNVPLIGRHVPQQLQVRAECQGGGTGCFPIRLYWVEVTGMPPATGLGGLSAPKQALSVGLCVLLCVLAAWLLSPWRSGASSGPA